MKKVFECRRCGYCCHGETTVSLDEDDQIRMLGALQISRQEALRKYWRVRDGVVQMRTVDGRCIFFADGCTVHQGRPWRCREWPLVRAIVVDEINLKTIRLSCPGIEDGVTYKDICKVIEKGAFGSGGTRSSGKEMASRDEI